VVRRARLDAELVRRGLARSREHAAELIAAGAVKVSGQVASKPATGVEPATPVVVVDRADDPGYASRGGHKLAGALTAFGPLGLQVGGRRCLDAGASTGGFTDVLLARGATRVYAIDVGRGQLHPKLSADPRVISREGTDARGLSENPLPEAVGLVTIDVSFISARLVLPALLPAMATTCELVLLVKPQFEAGRERVGRGGLVCNEAVRDAVAEEVKTAVAEFGFAILGLIPSPITGGDGNREFLLGARRLG
jgi:23S rRNA (cytidine1920-2'-O)/16S rRNA (cytidine1409-2'-O)-methyltransferase